EWYEQSSLVQLVDEAAHVQGNILDLCFANSIANTLNCSVGQPFGKSDHFSILFAIIGREEWKENRRVYKFKEADYEAMSLELMSFDWSAAFELLDYDLEACWCCLRLTLYDLIERYVPSAIIKVGTKDRYPNKIRRMQKKQLRLWREGKSTGDLTNYRECSRKCIEMINHFHRDLEERVLDSNNLNKLYSYVNGKCFCKSGVAPLADGDRVVTSDLGKAKLLLKFFKSVFTVDNDRVPHFDRRTLSGNDLGWVEFDPFTVYEALRRRKNKLSRTPDHIPAMLLKRLALELSEPLSIIFTLSFDTGTIPSDWKLADVTPILKKGDKSKAGNYRPVSNTANCGKTMEDIIDRAMKSHLAKYRLLSTAQHGFLAKHSCTTQLLECVNDWTLALSRKSPVDVVYLDFSKAFDSVSHAKLLHKCEQYGFTGKLLAWIRAFLVGRYMRVRVGNDLSEWATVESGVPQGSILGPLLFIIYVNDIVERLPRSVTTKLFADDIKLYSEIDSVAKTYRPRWI
ncbi:MAG: reverse transcriptase family protein, partial [Gammaproteobacteria bacterium]|nr:reverse transcriptase family protein [Gammaproteobacteria bacterium]